MIRSDGSGDGDGDDVGVNGRIWNGLGARARTVTGAEVKAMAKGGTGTRGGGSTQRGIPVSGVRILPTVGRENCYRLSFMAGRRRHCTFGV